MEHPRWKRPWLAAVLGTLATGFGHLYLRRWRRALGWLLIMSITSLLFVSESSIDAVMTSLWTGTGTIPYVDLIPLFIVGVVSAFDAYAIARMDNRRLLEQRMGIQRCPDCGRPVDPDVSFCQWCATPKSESNESTSTEH
jgi:hypothetical protein